MVVTPSSSQSHPTLHVPSTEPPAPPMLNVRRPRALRAGAASGPSEDFILATAVDDALLPPTVLRLPNLAAGTAASEGRSYSIASIAHWVAIVLGGLIALWLIFGGRRGEMPNPDAAPLPARAEAGSSIPAWVPPPLESAGDSSAPAWTPPQAAAVPAASTAPPAIETPSAADMAPAFEAPAAKPAVTAPAATAEPQQEAWPRPTTSEPATNEPPTSAPASNAPAPAAAPELAPAGTSAHHTPPGAATGPAVRTAQLEPRVDPAGPNTAAEDPAASEAQPLGITVPVPQ